MKAITLHAPKPVALDWKPRNSRYARGEAPTRCFSPKLASVLVRLDDAPMMGNDPVGDEEESNNPGAGTTPTPFNAD